MFGTFVKYKFQRTYDAILAAPVDTEELVTAEALWIAARAGVYGCAPLLVAMVFGLDPSWGMLLVPFIGFADRLRLGGFGVAIAALAATRSTTSATSRAPCSRRCSSSPARSSRSPGCPSGRRSLAQFNPLYHCVAARPPRVLRLRGLDRPLPRGRADRCSR